MASQGDPGPPPARPRRGDAGGRPSAGRGVPTPGKDRRETNRAATDATIPREGEPAAAGKARKPKSRMRPPSDWRERFLNSIRATDSVVHACQAAQVEKATAFRHRAKDPEFAEAWREAHDDAKVLMETEVRRRALHGWEEPVFYRGKVVGHVRKYSDTLAMFWLRANLPGKYRETPAGPADGGLALAAGGSPVTVLEVRVPQNSQVSVSDDRSGPGS